MKLLLVFICISVTCIIAQSQSVIFLHHSTGEGVYIEGNVAAWIANYNSANGTNYQIAERAYPDSPYPWQNYPYDYWYLWVNNQCSSTNINIQCLGNIAQNYNVIIFKHCFPGASIIADDGSPSVSSPKQTLANYKLQYRALRNLMDSYPLTRFIVWTLAPLHRLATNDADASRAKEFVDWVKTSWLTEDGNSHPNIYIFDFFGLVAELNPAPVNGKVNCLRYEYEKSHSDSDSHPNLIANQTVGPVFAQFIVNTIKNQQSDINDPEFDPLRIRIYPNPVKDMLTIDLSDFNHLVNVIEILNVQGKRLLNQKVKGEPVSYISTKSLPSGIYLAKFYSEDRSFTRKFSVLHE